jgi:hypothetical protein
MIYYIQRGADGPIKVGFSDDPKRRLHELQTGSGEPLRILAVIPGDRALEQEIHRRLQGCQGVGEWFKPSASELEYLQRLMNVQYEVIDDHPYAVLYRAAESEATEHCPFCFAEHQHGSGDGHRVAHCASGWDSVVAADGTFLERANGYIIRTGSRACPGDG